LLGSSTLFNRHLGEHVKTALQQRTDKKVELLDAGIRSHTSHADVLKWQLLAQYQWDYVLFYDGINDLWANHVLPEDYRADYAHIDPWYRRNVWLDNSLLLRYGFNTGWHWLHQLNRTAGEKWFPDYQFVFPKKPFVNAAQFASLTAYRLNVETLLTQIEQHQAQPVLLTFAFHLPVNYSRKAFMDNTLDYHNPDNYDKRDVFNWGPPDYVREGLQQQNTIVRQLALQHHVPLIDIDAKMSGKGFLFGDVCHFNDDGVAVFSSAVAQALFP
jgi:lysophospholipase L1-like esterase